MVEDRTVGNDNRKECPVCLSTDVTGEPFYYTWNHVRWTLHRCRACTHRFVYPFLTREEQAQIYRESYFSATGDWARGWFEAGYIDSEKGLRNEAAQVLKMIPIDKGVLLEIGCAGGFFLDEARQKGFTVIGVELNESMALFGRNKLGLNVMHAGVEDVSVEDLRCQCDVVVFMDVLEHIPRPYDAMRKASLWLRENGYLLVRGPIANDVVSKAKQWLRRVVGKEKQLEGYPLDVNVFSKKSLAYLLRNFGIDVVSWINETRGFANLLAQRGPAKPEQEISLP